MMVLVESKKKFFGFGSNNERETLATCPHKFSKNKFLNVGGNTDILYIFALG